VPDRPLVAYEPNPALAWLYHRFFEHIEVDEAWASAVREADKRGTVVYALRNLSFVDFFALDYLTKRLNLPQVRFANDLGLWVLEPMGRGWLHALATRSEASDAQDLRRAVAAGESAALFLKRPHNLLEPARRKGKSEGDAFLRTLLELQRTSDKPILLVPQVFVWSQRPDDARQSGFDLLLGPREWPGKIRTVAQFLMNYRHVTLRAGEPISLRDFLESETGVGVLVARRLESEVAARDDVDDVLVRRLTYALLRRLERERRSVIGPTKKPADRMREEVVRSPKLQKIISEMAGEGQAERQVLTWRAMAMVKEMEAAPDVGAIAAMDKVVDPMLARLYSDLDVDAEGLARVRAATKEGSLVLLPSHKSHMDYVLLAYLFYHNHLPTPIVAAGDNLAFFPLGAVFRRAGAFFIRRSFGGDRLYGAVVDAYMRRLIKDGFSLEFFLEGGRSRTGKLLPPKLGLLSLVVDAGLGVTGRRLSFVPISIGYERVVEEKAFVRELTGGEKTKEDVRALLSTAGIFKGRYGRINVQFGELLSIEGVMRELGLDPRSAVDGGAALPPPKRRAIVTRLGYRAMNEVNRVTAVTPGALVATALLTHARRGIAHADLVRSCRRLARTLLAFGARFTPSLLDSVVPGASPVPQEGGANGASPPARPSSETSVRASAIREALDLFARAGHVVVRHPGAGSSTAERLRPGEEAIYIVPDEARLSLDLSKNIVVHFFVSRALVATAILATPPADGMQADPSRVPLDAVRERVRALSRLFKYEFQFRADATFEQNFDETIGAMCKDGELGVDAGSVCVAGEEGRVQVVLYSEIVKNFIEAYRVAGRGLTALLKGPLAQKDLVKRAIATGERMFLAGEIERREAVSRPVLENAYAAFVDQGYVARADGKLTLPESYASPNAVRTIEARVAGFLVRRLEAP
jgi:glycerol-3-phosphate O-acyltransferase